MKGARNQYKFTEFLCTYDHEGRAYMPWTSACSWCLKWYCDDHIAREEHDCQGTHDIIKEEILKA